MKRYLVEFIKKAKEENVIINPLEPGKVIKLDFPALEEEIYLPVYYNVSLIKGNGYKKIGKLGAWMAENYPPEDFHIRTIALNRTTLLSFKD